MSRRRIIAGNWKMNKTPSEAVALVNELLPLVKNDDVDVVFFPDTDPLSGAKEILSEVSAICSKNDTVSGGVPATVKPGQQRRGFFFTGRGI